MKLLRVFFQILHYNPDSLNDWNTRVWDAELQERRFLLNEGSPIVVHPRELKGSCYPADAPTAVVLLPRRAAIVVEKSYSGLTFSQDIVACCLSECWESEHK